MSVNKLKGRTVTKRVVKQTIDLKEAFGIDFTGKKALKEKIGQLLIDKMIERTSKKSLGVNGKALKNPYTKSYQNSAEYERYGKTGKINMDLKGTMLDNIDVKNVTANTIDLAITKSVEKLKAFGHISGFEGHPNSGKMKKYKRDFFGVTKKEIAEVKRKVAGELSGARQLDSDSELALKALTDAKGSAVVDELINSFTGSETALEALIAKMLAEEL